MTDLVKLCPSCGRKPSTAFVLGGYVKCPDPIHNLADLGPALADVLEKAAVILAGDTMTKQNLIDVLEQSRAVLRAAGRMRP